MATEALVLTIDATRGKAGAREWKLATSQVVRGSTDADTSIRRLERRMGSLQGRASGLRRVLGGLFAGVSGALALRSATRTLAGFEEALAALQGVSGATGETFERLQETARRLGATSRFTATEAAEGLLFLARAGFSAQQSMEAIAPVLNLALGGMLDLGRAADIASNVLRQFGLETSETERVVDTLVNTANSANTSVEQLAQALIFAGPIAGQLGLTVEETAATIGALGDAGIQASLAGTQLRGIFAALLGPTTEAKEELDKLGISAEEAGAIFAEGLIPVFQALRDNGLDATKAFEVFNRRTATGALIAADSVEKIAALAQANLEAAGTAQKMADIFDATLIGSFKALASAAQENVLTLGDKGLTGVLKSIVDSITDVLRLWVGFDDVLRGSRTLAENLSRAFKGVAAGVGFFVGLRVAIWSASTALAVFNAALLANPLTAIAVGISGAIAAFVAFKEEILGVEFFGKRLGDVLFAVFHNIRERILFTVDVMAEVFSALWPAIRAGAVELFDAMARFARVAFANIGINWSKTWDFALDGLRSFVNTGLALIVGFSGAVENLVDRIRFVAAVLEQVDLSDPLSIVTTAQLLPQLKRALSPTNVAQDFAKTFGDAFERDFVSEMADAAKKGFDALARTLELLSPTFDRERFATLFNPFAQPGRIAQLAEARAQLRAIATEVSTLSALAASTAFGFPLFARGGTGFGGVPGRASPEGLGEGAEDPDQLVRPISTAFKGAVADIVLQVDSIEGAFKSLAQSVIRTLLDEFTGDAIKNVVRALLSSFGLSVAKGAKGMITGHGGVQPFAAGGIIDRPTFFPLAGGRTGLAGEAGPEAAIAPLRRGAGGRLGVEIVRDESDRGASSADVVRELRGLRADLRRVEGFGRSHRQLQGSIARSG